MSTDLSVDKAVDSGRHSMGKAVDSRSKLPKIKQAIIDYFKKDQMNMLRSYKKL